MTFNLLEIMLANQIGEAKAEQGAAQQAAESLAKAKSREPERTSKAVAAGKKKDSDSTPILFSRGLSSDLRLMTGGDQRLAKALRQDALNVFVAADAESS